MPTITYQCDDPDCGYICERQNSIKVQPPDGFPCVSELSCMGRMVRVWEAPQFICDRADADHNHVPEQYRVSDRVVPETAAQGRAIERAHKEKLARTRREVAENPGSSFQKEQEIPAHLYHGKIRQTGDRNYWLQKKNRDKHSAFNVKGYGRSGRG
jgi:hypothetical protein